MRQAPVQSMRRGVWFWRICLGIFAWSLLACSWPLRSTKKPDELPPVMAEDPKAQQSFDDALAALERGEYEDALESFRLVQADYPDDPIAALAELYAARAMLGDVDFSPQGKLQSSASPEQVELARRSLEALGEGRRVDERVRFAARVYQSIALALQDRAEESVRGLSDYPGASLGSVVLERDRPAAWMMLCESMWRARRHDEALIAAARLHDSVARRLEAAGEEVSEGDTRVARLIQLYARGRGFEAALEHVEDRDLQMKFLTSEEPFLQAAAGWALLQRRADDELDDRARATLEDIYQRASSAMVTIGALERAAEMSSLMATLGSQRRLVIGALVPMSGKNRPIGQRVMRGMLLAQQAFDTPDQPRLTLVFRDSTADPRANLDALAEQGALAVIGPIERELAAPYAAAAQEVELPLLMMTTEALRPEGDPVDAAPGWVFRNFLNAEAEARAVAAISHDRWGDRRAAIVFPEVGYGRLMAATFRAAFEARGGVVVAEVGYDRGATDFSRVARAVARARPDAIFIPDTGGKVAEVIAFMARENFWGLPGAKRPEAQATKRRLVHYLGTSLWQDPFLLRQAGAYIEGATIPAWYSAAATDDASRLFTSRYRAVFGAEPSIYEAFAYDSVSWLRQVILETGMRRPSSVRDALLAPSPHEGVTGSARFTVWGEPDRDLRFVIIDGATFTPLDATQPIRAREFIAPPKREVEGTGESEGDDEQP